MKFVSWVNKYYPIRSSQGLIYVTVGNLITSALGGILWLIMAQIATTEDYGELNYFLAITAIPSTIAVFGLNNIVIMMLSKKDDGRIIPQANSLILVLNFVIGLILFLIYNNFLIVALFVFSTTYVMSASELLGKQMYKNFALMITTQKIVLLILTIVMYHAFSIDGALAGQIIAAAAFSFNFFRSLKSFSFHFDVIRLRLKLIINNFVITMSQTLVGFLDKIVIGPLFGFLILGYYQLGAQLLLMMNVIPSSLFLYLLSRRSHGKANSKVIFYGLLASGLISISIIYILPSFLDLMFPKFTSATSAIRILLIGLVPQTIISIISSTFIAAEKPKPVLYSSALYILVLLFLFFTLGQWYGLIGLAIASTLALITQAITLLIINFRTKLSHYNSAV